MIIPNDPDKFLSSWKYLETAKYVQSLGRVIRQKDGDNTLFIEAKDKESFRQQNGNVGLYTSIWHYNSTDLDKAIRLGSLYFDIDNKDPQESYSDCTKLYNYLINYIPKSAVLVYFTGKKGFHIECEAITLGINPSNNLPNIFRFIASTLKDKLKLESLDFSVYDARRMWRLEGSKHQDTNLYKNLIPEDILLQGMDTITSYCTTRSSNEVSEQNFNAKANEWFREFTYDMEIEKEKSKDFIGYFNKYGSTAFKQMNVKEKEFTPDKLLKSCTSIARLQQQAIEKKYLEH